MIRSIMRPRTTLQILVHTFQQHLINYLTIGKYFTCCSMPSHFPQVLYNSKIPGLFRHEWLVEAIAVLASGDQMVAFLPTWGAPDIWIYMYIRALCERPKNIDKMS